MKRLVVIGFLAVITAGAAHAQNKSVSPADFARPDLVRRFEIHVPQTTLDSLMKKVKTATLPPQMPPRDSASDWESGMDMKWLKGLQSYWVNSFDWRKQERLLNSYPRSTRLPIHRNMAVKAKMLSR